MRPKKEDRRGYKKLRGRQNREEGEEGGLEGKKQGWGKRNDGKEVRIHRLWESQWQE